MLVEIVGKFYDNHSLSIVNRNIALELAKITDVRLASTQYPSTEFSIDPNVIDTLVGLSAVRLEPVDIEVRHTYPPIWEWPYSKKTKVVFIQPWEFSSMPSEWQYKFDTFADAVIVPSEWTKRIYRNAGINPEKLFVVPNGYNPDIFYPISRTEKTVRILYVGNSQYRKGVDVLLKAWAQVTNKNQDVELIIKDSPNTYGSSDLLDTVIKVQFNSKCGKITYIDSELSETDIAKLYQQSDYVVHPYRGEGFGMHIQEAMACGAYPITTEGGPTDEFAIGSKIRSTQSVVDMQQIFAIKPGDSLSNMGSHRWVIEPDLNNLCEHLHKAITVGSRVAKNTSNLTTWASAAQQYKNIFSLLQEREVVRR